MKGGASDRAPRRGGDPEPTGEQDGRHDDPARIAERRDGVEHEAAMGDEDLTEGHGCREHDLGEAVDPQQLDIEVPGRWIEVLADDAAQPGREQKQARARQAHDDDRSGQCRPAETIGRLLVPGVPFAEAVVDGHERGGESSRHQDIEGDLRDPERRVVGIELGPGTVGIGEDAVTDHAQREIGEGQDRQDDRAAREDAIDERADRRHGAPPDVQPSAARSSLASQ